MSRTNADCLTCGSDIFPLCQQADYRGCPCCCHALRHQLEAKDRRLAEAEQQLAAHKKVIDVNAEVYEQEKVRYRGRLAEAEREGRESNAHVGSLESKNFILTGRLAEAEQQLAASNRMLHEAADAEMSHETATERRLAEVEAALTQRNADIVQLCDMLLESAGLDSQTESWLRKVRVEALRPVKGTENI